MTYSDVLAMPTYERRYFLGLLTKQAREREEEMEEMKYEQFDELAPENVIKQDIGNRYLRKHHRPPPRY